MTLPQVDQEKGTKMKCFRFPIPLIREMEAAAKKDNRTLTGYIINLVAVDIQKQSKS